MSQHQKHPARAAAARRALAARREYAGPAGEPDPTTEVLDGADETLAAIDAALADDGGSE